MCCVRPIFYWFHMDHARRKASLLSIQKLKTAPRFSPERASPSGAFLTTFEPAIQSTLLWSNFQRWTGTKLSLCWSRRVSRVWPMRILLDEFQPRGPAALITGDDVMTVNAAGWTRRQEWQTSCTCSDAIRRISHRQPQSEVSTESKPASRRCRDSFCLPNTRAGE